MGAIVLRDAHRLGTATARRGDVYLKDGPTRALLFAAIALVALGLALAIIGMLSHGKHSRGQPCLRHLVACGTTRAYGGIVVAGIADMRTGVWWWLLGSRRLRLSREPWRWTSVDGDFNDLALSGGRASFARPAPVRSG